MTSGKSQDNIKFTSLNRLHTNVIALHKLASSVFTPEHESNTQIKQRETLFVDLNPIGTYNIIDFVLFNNAHYC